MSQEQIALNKALETQYLAFEDSISELTTLKNKMAVAHAPADNWAQRAVIASSMIGAVHLMHDAATEVLRIQRERQPRAELKHTQKKATYRGESPVFSYIDENPYVEESSEPSVVN